MKEIYIKGNDEFIEEILRKAKRELGREVKVIDLNPELKEKK